MAPALAQDRFSAPRERMMKHHLEGRGIRNLDVLRVMRVTPRHLFVPPEFSVLAYDDQPLPIGHGATISQPYIVALMTELLEPAKTHRVLEIGTGSGYQAAVLAQLAARVFTIEIVPELADSARDRLKQLGYSNVSVRAGNGYLGWPEEAPFDRIILTAAPPSVPQALLDQLAKAGRLVAPVGPLRDQDLLLFEKTGDGKLRQRRITAVTFVPMVRGRE